MRVIGVDRPGMGLSTFQRGRTLLDWPDDVLQLMDGLGIERFSVLGGSAGGAYALACARVIERGRLRGVGVVSGYAPPGSGLGGLSPKERFLLGNPSVMRAVMYWRVGRFVHSRNDKVWRDMAREMGYEGNDIAGVLESLREPFKQGVNGYVHDGVLINKEWGFELEEVKGKVRLWYGDEDENTPIEMGKWMEERLSGGSLKTFEGEDHFSLLTKRGERILKELVSDG